MWANTFGVPDKILTDNRGEFNNEELHDMSENLNTEGLATAAESPWSNGICNRLIRNGLVPSWVPVMVKFQLILPDFYGVQRKKAANHFTE